MPPHSVHDLEALARRLRGLPGVTAKASIGVVADVFGGGDWWAGPGDDGAVVHDRGRDLIACGEAMLPAFVAKDPYGAGVAAVLANVNDLAAMGARPLAIVDTFTGPRDVAKAVLEGLKWAADVYDVPVVGGHLTETDGPPSLSAFGLGSAGRVLSATHAEPGQALVLACCLDGKMRDDFLFFPSFEERSEHLAGDVRTLAEVAERGAAVAAKDVSMAGMIGSLAMLLEARKLGVLVDLDVLPVPAGTPVEDWLSCFPCFAFLLTTPAAKVEECVTAFTSRGLTARRIGTLDDTGEVRVGDASGSVVVFDLKRESVTRLARDPADPDRGGRRSTGTP
ncbi:AIR synthase related protein [Microbispora sp. H11081]|uniref:AIR synthase related protein n=1 Tax=Microbispora sp. H11081 TaxID=2729107 RepID=UPI0014754548|nr:AIR synthase related protein [Microbispora sp. H11081]